ncbi:hypothetical protein BJ508DRAFT_328156 [Ascobolus immersus RN42]|uniref:Uncharacterized protein n=1 Tax=Ascobolus immersus RN42 TaxID=1160509 RepID=A0A3N4I5Y9_ASCIM|nr:hypothetical protein BJ508DRAFT_328156 [Ascobolus immersus RN42]
MAPVRNLTNGSISHIFYPLLPLDLNASEFRSLINQQKQHFRSLSTQEAMIQHARMQLWFNILRRSLMKLRGCTITNTPCHVAHSGSYRISDGVVYPTDDEELVKYFKRQKLQLERMSRELLLVQHQKLLMRFTVVRREFLRRRKRAVKSLAERNAEMEWVEIDTGRKETEWGNAEKKIEKETDKNQGIMERVFTSVGDACAIA